MATPPLLSRARAAWSALTKPAAVPAPAKPAGGGKRTLVRHGAYRGADITRLTGDSIARTQSPVDQLRGDLRILRARARDMSLNDPLAKKYLSVMSAQVLGPRGPRLQAQVRDANGDLDDAVNRRIESAWEEWCRGPVSLDGCFNLPQFEQLCFRTMIGDGETFVRKIVGVEHRHGLALQGIDADMVDERYTMLASQNGGMEIWLGVEVDGNGARQAYHLFDGLYSQTFMARPRKRVPASEIQHLFVAERFNQARGVSWFAPVMVTSMHLNGFIEAVMVGSRAGASQMAFIKQDPDQITSQPAESEGDPDTTQPVEAETSPGTITRLAPGEEMQAFTPSQPTDIFAPFTTAVSRFIATGLGVSYAALTGDFSQANYSSERAARLVERVLCMLVQESWAYRFRQPIYEKWLDTAVLSGALKLPSYDASRYKSARWIMQGQDWVDPLKDVEASHLELQLCLTSVTRVLAERGENLEEMLREIQSERLLGAKYGIDFEKLIAAAGKPGPGAPAAGSPKATATEPDPAATTD